MKDELPARGRRINRTVAQRLESDAALTQVFDHVDEVPHGAAKPVKPPNDQGIAGL